ncbi:hypothetical protein DFH06DRAFT_376313 [Mycena polygramma]|nr:hypothetical protein DFH06DRAFT_376313 [Mycena polygramma]
MGSTYSRQPWNTMGRRGIFAPYDLFAWLTRLYPKTALLCPCVPSKCVPLRDLGYFDFPELSSGRGKGCNPQWLKSRLEEPVRFAKLLLSIRGIIHQPVIEYPNQSDAYTMCKNDLIAYDKRVRAQAEAWKPDPRTGLAGRPIRQPIKEEEK